MLRAITAFFLVIIVYPLMGQEITVNGGFMKDTIVIGEVYNLESKFNKLMLFYEEGLSKTGWNEYKTINLKYKDQVVCTKRY